MPTYQKQRDKSDYSEKKAPNKFSKKNQTMLPFNKPPCVIFQKIKILSKLQ